MRGFVTSICFSVMHQILPLTWAFSMCTLVSLVPLLMAQWEMGFSLQLGKRLNEQFGSKVCLPALLWGWRCLPGRGEEVPHQITDILSVTLGCGIEGKLLSSGEFYEGGVTTLGNWAGTPSHSPLQDQGWGKLTSPTGDHFGMGRRKEWCKSSEK